MAVYYSGFVTEENKFQAEPRLRAAWDAYATGWFDLTQKRIGRNDFDFIIQRRRRQAIISDPYRVGYYAVAA
jgi:hypothetical protein